MSESGEWDKRMTETLKNFDPNSPEVKQGFGIPNKPYQFLYTILWL